MKSKEELASKAVVDVISVCQSISKLNPRNQQQDVSKSPLMKQIRKFTRYYEQFEPKEILEMVKVFYSKYYLDAIEDDTGTDWMEQDITLQYGPENDPDSISFNISNYYRVAKDIDSNSSKLPQSKKWKAQLKYDVLKLLMICASSSMKDKLEEKVDEMEVLLGKTSGSSSGTSSSSANGSEMLSSVFETLNKTAKQLGPKFQEALTSNESKQILDNVNSHFPPELKNIFNDLIGDISKGTFNLDKTLGNFGSIINNITKEDEEPKEANLIDFSEDDDEKEEEEKKKEVVCDEDSGVCFIQN